MSNQWCTHPTAHVGKTKIGSKPNHPRGDRRLDDDFRCFIDDSYGILRQSDRNPKEHRFCRTCFEKERKRFNESKLQQSRNDERLLENNDDENPMPTRSNHEGSKASESSGDENSDHSGSSSSAPQSPMEEVRDEYEYQYTQEELKNRLNSILEILNIPRISDK